MIASRVLISLISTCALATFFFAPRATHADSGDQPPTITVRFGDLNLDTRTGVEALFRRIKIAAAEVCQKYGPRGTYLPSVAHRSCMKNAVSGAVSDIGSAALKAYYNERARSSSPMVASR